MVTMNFAKKLFSLGALVSLLALSGLINQAQATGVFTISGTVTQGAAPVSGVTVTATVNGSSFVYATNSSGYFEIPGVLYGAPFKLVPFKSGLSFSPGSAQGTVIGNMVDNFTASPMPLFTISGTVTVGPAPLPAVTMSGTINGVTTQVMTNSSGYYEFAGAPFGAPFKVVPWKSGFSFSPTFVQGTVIGNMVENFTATPSSSSSSSSSSGSSVSEKCISTNLVENKSVAALGPQQLHAYAARSLDFMLQGILKATNCPSQRKFLAHAIEITGRKIIILVQQATVAFQDLPDVMVTCPNGLSCTAVDNSLAISQHITAVTQLEKVTLRNFNRAQRWVWSRFPVQNKQINRLKVQTRNITKKLIVNAESIPPTSSKCS
jgi:hypothetical protein